MPDRLPILVLAGSDLKPAPVPRGLRRDQMLTGYKGACPLPSGRCLVAELVERIRGSEQFAEPLLVGPRRIFAGKVDCEIVDADGTLLTTLNRVTEVIQSRFDDPFAPVALSTCDILPTPDEFRQLLHEAYEPVRECMFWWQFIEAAPEALGASAWKPSYSIRPDAGEPFKNLYPGHLVIVRPGALRTDLLVHVLRSAYRFRNSSIRTRHLRMLAHGLAPLLLWDVLTLLSFRLPWRLPAVATGLRVYYKLRRRTLTVREFERLNAKIFLHRKYQRPATGRPLVCSVSPILSFAKDIDTQAELEEAAASAI